MTPKLLVANRSEIACRVFQACRELGIPTVGLLVPGDEQARHVTFANELIELPSYLDGERIVEAAKAAGVTLIHPGYGFLSERPYFARAVEKAGITFIGPRAETMELMGEKIAAKEIAEKAGVPTLPWARVEEGKAIRDAAKNVGFPLLLKAAAGGGGKGMRRVTKPEELEPAAESAAAEAKAAFGDGTLFIERLVEKPRHIEVQVFGNGRGGGVHLGERDCSLQRKHQKVWEEAPAPDLPEKVRQGLYDAALRLIREVKYRNAGTLEFLVSDQGEFFFLEMNTRLQVEHPVTENVTGVDLVHTQIRQALEPQKDVLSEPPTLRGHSIEVRLYAEDPSQGFMPTPGLVEKLMWPTGIGIRVESGIEEGQRIGAQFDSMLGKLVVTAPDRDTAIRRMRFALDETVILGASLGTNQAFLSWLCEQPAVRAGRTDTGMIEREFLSQWKSLPSGPELELLVAARKAGLARGGAGARVEPEAAGEKTFPSPWSAS